MDIEESMASPDGATQSFPRTFPSEELVPIQMNFHQILRQEISKERPSLI